MSKKKTGKLKIILIALLTVILLVFAVQFIMFMVLKTDAKKYSTSDIPVRSDDRLDMVGMLDSYGVPFSPKVDDSFFEIYTKKLKDEGKLSSELDIFGLYLNKTWHLDGVFKNGITVGEMKKMQDFSIGFTRHKYGSKIRSDLIYSTPENMEDKTVYDHVAGLDNPVICYSCSGNDLFYYYGFSLEGLNAQRCIEMVKGFGKARKLLTDGVKGNIDTLLACNPDSQIYVLGLYVPSSNFFAQRIGSIAIDAVNRDLKAVCGKYENVHFVDVSCVSFAVLEGDFHPDQDGQKMIAARLAEAVNNTYVSKDSGRTPVSYKDSFPAKTETEYSGYVNEIVNRINNSNLPVYDYVEAAVAFERVLYDMKAEKMDHMDLTLIKQDIVFGVKPEIRKNISDGIDICIIERKILYGVNEAEFSSHPETVLNDKLSLIEYY